VDVIYSRNYRPLSPSISLLSPFISIVLLAKVELIGVGGAIIGFSLGSRCFELISNRTLKLIVYAMMIVSGVVAIL